VSDRSRDFQGRTPRAATRARRDVRPRAVLDAADELLAREGVPAFTTKRIAERAGISVGALHRRFADCEAVVEALAVAYWSDLEDLVAGLAEADELDRFDDPTSTFLDTLSAGFRARPGFLALWYGGLLTERVRDAVRPRRDALARSVGRMLAARWPDAPIEPRAEAARMIVLTGDRLLLEAFRLDEDGDDALLAEGRLVLRSYLAARLGPA
jgi:AcrR family transcriptional regulator